jgi:hypothetical protein
MTFRRLALLFAASCSSYGGSATPPSGDAGMPGEDGILRLFLTDGGNGVVLESCKGVITRMRNNRAQGAISYSQTNEPCDAPYVDYVDFAAVPTTPGVVSDNKTIVAGDNAFVPSAFASLRAAASGATILLAATAAGCTLARGGLDLRADIPLDIAGAMRDAHPSIGAWELAPAMFACP